MIQVGHSIYSSNVTPGCHAEYCTALGIPWSARQLLRDS